MNPSFPPDRPPSPRARACWLGLLLGLASAVVAAEELRPPPNAPISRIPFPGKPANMPTREASKTESPRTEQLREAIEQANASPAASASTPRAAAAKKSAAGPAPAPTPQFTFTVEPDKKATPARRGSTTTAAAPASPAPQRTASATSEDDLSRQYIRARAAALGAFATTPSAAAAVGVRPSPRNAPPKATANEPTPWSYQGAGGPLSWGQLKPEFATCASGQRQSPIAIDDTTALQGPAEPLGLDYRPSTGSVLHTGRTLQVDVQGENALTVRGVRYRLERVEFHHPAEERINGKGFAMAAHLLHRSADGQLATVAVLLEPGATSPLVDQVWTYLPLDVGDRVGLPPGGLDVGTLLPQDQRYYQFFGSLTTPPCTEEVLWIVFKQPMTVSASQLKLFGQLFPNNARPLQPANGRVVRAAQ